MTVVLGLHCTMCTLDTYVRIASAGGTPVVCIKYQHLAITIYTHKAYIYAYSVHYVAKCPVCETTSTMHESECMCLKVFTACDTWCVVYTHARELRHQHQPLTKGPLLPVSPLAWTTQGSRGCRWTSCPSPWTPSCSRDRHTPISGCT